MKKIYKYPVPEIVDEQEIMMPVDAQILCVQLQHGEPCMWAMVDSDLNLIKRKFRIIGAGHPIEDFDSLNYIDTFQLAGGQLVFHVFEKIEGKV